MGFGAPQFSEESLTEILRKIQSDLREEGFQSEFQVKHAGAVFTSAIKLTTALQHYGLSPLPQEKLAIKIEVYCPSWELKERSEIIQGFGRAFPVLLLQESELLAEKIHALLNRKRGRDIYDLFFHASEKLPLGSRNIEEPGVAGRRL